MFTRARNFCFTLNSPEPAEYEFWRTLCSSQRARDAVQCVYVIYQEEQTQRTEGIVIPWHSATGNELERTIMGRVLGVKHLQGYVELSRAIRLAGIKLRFGPRAHYEKRRGTQAQCIAYCKKEETRLQGGASGEGGEAKLLGKDKLSVVTAELQLGKNLSTLSHDYPQTFIKRGPQIIAYALSQLPDRDEAPKIYILYGKTGTGKTAEAHKRWPEAFWVPRPKKGGWWWYGYTGQKCIALDEWRKGLCSFGTALELFDRYAMTVQCKGACMKMLATTIVVTTNIDPMQWYPGIPWDDKAPLRRRLHDFTEIWDVEDDSTWDDFKYTVRTQL